MSTPSEPTEKSEKRKTDAERQKEATERRKAAGQKRFVTWVQANRISEFQEILDAFKGGRTLGLTEEERDSIAALLNEQLAMQKRLADAGARNDELQAMIGRMVERRAEAKRQVAQVTAERDESRREVETLTPAAEVGQMAMTAPGLRGRLARWLLKIGKS